MSGASEFMPITKPIMGARERELMLRPLDTGWLVQGPYVQLFEEKFAAYAGVAHAVAVSSCTTALHLILHALGVGPGDEVIVPSFTFVASANAVEYTGARPVLADIDPATFNLSLESAQRLIGPRTKVIMPVSLFGLCADVPACNALAAAQGLKVVEDAACAAGSFHNQRHAGSQGVAGAFSFHPRKTITTGEGGMITTNDAELAELVGKLRGHGAEATDLQRHHDQGGSLLPAFNLLGFNYRMTDMQGALGVAQMERLEDIVGQRRRAAAIYDALLADSPMTAPSQPPGQHHTYQSYVILFGWRPGQSLARTEVDRLNQARNRTMQRMEAAGIQVRQGTHAVHTLGYYARKYGYAEDDLPMSLAADRLSLTLPLFKGITPQQQERVVGYLLDGWREP